MENIENIGKNLHNLPKKPKFFLKSFLIRFYNFSEEDHIGHWIADKFIRFFVKSIDIIVTGILMQVALVPVHMLLFHFSGFTVPVNLLPVWIVSYGLIWNACENIHERIVDGRIKSNLALPKMYLRKED